MSYTYAIDIFDGVVLDAKLSAMSISDLDKILENEQIKKIIIANWDKAYIKNNAKIILRIMSKSNVTFSLIGTNSADIEEMKKLVSGYEIKKEVFSFSVDKYFALTPWIKNINDIFIWDFVQGSMTDAIKSYIDKSNKNINKFLITTDKKNGLFNSTVNSLLSLSGPDKYAISTYGSYLRSKNTEMIITVSIKDIKEIEENYQQIVGAVSDLGISSVLVVFSNSINKNSLNYMEYEILDKLSDRFSTFVYGMPFDKFGNPHPDLDRFKWLVNVNNINKLILNLDQFNINNLYYI